MNFHRISISHTFLYISIKLFAQTNCDSRDKAKNMYFYVCNNVIAKGFIKKVKIKLSKEWNFIYCSNKKYCLLTIKSYFLMQSYFCQR